MPVRLPGPEQKPEPAYRGRRYFSDAPMPQSML